MAVVKTFELPESGLEYIQTTYRFVQNASPTVLFLDLNMPTMTGWEFLESFEQFEDEVKKRIHIHILSSSVDEGDKERAAANKYVKAYLTKPLTKEAMLTAYQ